EVRDRAGAHPPGARRGAVRRQPPPAARARQPLPLEPAPHRAALHRLARESRGGRRLRSARPMTSGVKGGSCPRGRARLHERRGGAMAVVTAALLCALAFRAGGREAAARQPALGDPLPPRAAAALAELAALAPPDSAGTAPAPGRRPPWPDVEVV